jgi:hypothetical protein
MKACGLSPANNLPQRKESWSSVNDQLAGKPEAPI